MAVLEFPPDNNRSVKRSMWEKGHFPNTQNVDLNKTYWYSIYLKTQHDFHCTALKNAQYRTKHH